jgi:two-component system, cell cycle sensor histidine kinase and response regulator CckA
VLEVGGDQPDGIRLATRGLVDKVATQIALAFERDEQFKKLQVSEERFRSIFNQVSFGIALARLAGRLSKINPALARLLGAACEELEGKHFAEIIPAQDATAIETWIQKLRNGQTSQVTFERCFMRKSGEPLWCATTIHLLQDGPGKSPYFLAMVQNITNRKNDEEEHSRLQQQLFQAQKMEALGTLAGGIAHDFNNLLNVMLGFASLARQRLKADDPLQDSMEMIEESAERAAELALQLLGFARPEKQPMKPVLVQEVVQRVRRMAERTFDRSVKIEVSASSDPIWVNSEPSYIEQALLNLCLNARDAMPKGGKLSLELGPTTNGSRGDESGQSTPPDHVAISVQDTGMGINSEHLPKIFEPFFTTKDPGRGTGLGLAMVYGFVKSHSGEVKVESHPGKGTRITMVLPMVPAPPPQDASELIEEELGEGTVLLVDDEPLVRAFALEGLKRLGYQVLVAENGRQALEIYAKNAGSIDCVLLDLIMPELTGLETYRRLLALDPQVNVLFASGYSTGEILREAPDAQQASFIGKPYSLENLAVTLRKTISGQKCCK